MENWIPALAGMTAFEWQELDPSLRWDDGALFDPED